MRSEGICMRQGPSKSQKLKLWTLLLVCGVIMKYIMGDRDKESSS